MEPSSAREHLEEVSPHDPVDEWEDAAARGEEPTFGEALVVSPARGRLRRSAIEAGSIVEQGTLLGLVEVANGSRPIPVHAPAHGTFLGWLAWEGEGVIAGALVAHISRNGGP